MTQPRFVLGSTLPAALQAECLRSFPHRYTKEHVPAWAKRPRPNGKPYRPQFATDAEWLAGTQFAVTIYGRLDNRVRHCLTISPTWPDGQD